MEPQTRSHILVVAFPAQGHINPSLRLARRLAGTAGNLVTFSTAVSAHHRMFPPATSALDPQVHDGLLSYIPYSDGFDDRVTAVSDDPAAYMSRLQEIASTNLSTLVDGLAARGRPVTCIVYNMVMPWAADVARERGIPSTLLWIQPATVLAIYYHYFNGYKGVISAHCHDPLFTVNLPGLPPLRIRDLPPFLTGSPDDPYSAIIDAIRMTFEGLKREQTRAKVVVNTFDSLEADALASVENLELVLIGPLVDWAGGDLYKGDGKGYMEWLDSKADRSVVLVSFGTLSTLKRRQVEEIARGLAECGRPYLWSIRKDRLCKLEEGEEGMVVEWCSQTRVLSHPAIGCFVTHCGWNSTLESLTCGVPTVGLPQWADQKTIARMAEEEWGTGVSGEVDEEGVMDGRELQRCLEMVMGDGERGVKIRRRAETWRDRAREAIKKGGSSDRNIINFQQKPSIIGCVSPSV